jgi:hypothetical protein
MEQRGGILQATCFINQLFDIHRNSHAFCNAPRPRTGFSGFCDPRGFVQFGADLGQYDPDFWFDRGAIHAPVTAPHTLGRRRKSSRIPSNLMALFAGA